MTLSNEELADICEKAADVIHTRGHNKDGYQDEGGRVCAVGAMRVAMFGTPYILTEVSEEDQDKSEEVQAFLSTKLPEYDCDLRIATGGNPYVPHWNDLPETTQADVEDWFKNVAKDLRNG